MTEPGQQAQSAEKPISWPEGTQVLGETALKRAHIVAIGRSGVGKSFQVKLLTERFGVDSVLVVAAEDSSATYELGTRIKRVKRLSDVAGLFKNMEKAALVGARVAPIVVVDSWSGIGDFEWEYYREKPILSERTGNPDTLAAYQKLGYEGISALKAARELCPVTVISFFTSAESGPGVPPTICFPGKLMNDSIGRLSTVAFYMKAEQLKAKPADVQAKFADGVPKNISLGRDEDGDLDGTVVARYFYTMDTGEVQAKGHWALNIKERAILPDVLVKMGLIGEKGATKP